MSPNVVEAATTVTRRKSLVFSLVFYLAERLPEQFGRSRRLTENLKIYKMRAMQENPMKTRV